MNSTLLEVRDLHTYFFLEGGPAKAVEGVDFRIERGKTLGLVGESGCGKSATALSILRLIPSPPGKTVGGKVIFEGRNLLELPERQMRAVRGCDIAMIFQEPMTSLNPVFTIGWQIVEVILNHEHVSKKEAWERTVDMLRRVHIPSPQDRATDYPHQLSGGMRQRVMIAMALACSPKLLIADEPTTALDVTIQREVLDLIAGLVAEDGMALLLISHDLGVMAENVQQMLVMYGGTVVESGPTADVFRHLAHPYTRGLFAARPRLGLRAGVALAPGGPGAAASG
ncbi:MAG: ABC transporter ATP-binding protein, partial [Planctomycetes bacterium]|nr:ABC transporter ATP-binding protein [Planctomycetota bacterium]